MLRAESLKLCETGLQGFEVKLHPCLALLRQVVFRVLMRQRMPETL